MPRAMGIGRRGWGLAPVPVDEGETAIAGVAILDFDESPHINSIVLAASRFPELVIPTIFTGHDFEFGMDLQNIAFDANATIGYSTNNDISAEARAVSDSSLANIGLFGGMTSGFAVASDGLGGTLVTEPQSSQQMLSGAVTCMKRRACYTNPRC